MPQNELVITNTGEEGSLLNYSITKSYPDVSSPFDVTGGGPDSYGYFWSDSDINNNIDYEWIDISTDGIPVTFNSNDTGTENLNIGFDFPFYGETYTDFIINANGWIGFGEDSDAWYNGNIPSTDAPRSAIFGFWDDLNPVNDNCNSSCTGNVYYHSSAERLVVTFDNVAHWASEGFEDSFYTFQVVIYPSGEVDININSIIGNYSATVGMQNAYGTIALQVDEYNGSYFNDSMSFNFAIPFIPSDWLSILTISGLSGELDYNEYAVFTLEADASELIVGEYSADVLISTNSSSTEQISIILNVVDTMGILGDVNGDQEIIVSMLTDFYGGDLSWQLIDLTNNTVVAEANSVSLLGTTTYIDTFCALQGTPLEFVINDLQGDGFGLSSDEIVSPILISFTPAIAIISPASNFCSFVRS